LESKNEAPAIRKFELLEESLGKLSEIKRENVTFKEANSCSWLEVACCGLKRRNEDQGSSRSYQLLDMRIIIGYNVFRK
jgi:hypothetical protein